MAHMHLGSAVPLVFRRFPSIYGRSLTSSPSSPPLLLPDDLPGSLKLLLVCFTKKQHHELNSWIPHLQSLKHRFRRLHPHAPPDAFRAYRLVIRSRSARLFSGFLEDRWRILLDPLPPLPSSPLSPSSLASTAVDEKPTGAEGEEKEERREEKTDEEEKDKGTEVVREEEGGSTSARKTSEGDEEEFSSPSRCFFSYLDKRQFLSDAFLPDSQRPYLFLLNEEGQILWCEHEAFSLSKKAFGYQQVEELLQLSPCSSSSSAESLFLSPSSSFFFAQDAARHPTLPESAAQEKKTLLYSSSSSRSPAVRSVEEDLRVASLQKPGGGGGGGPP